jgi:hypothetical protein
VAIFQHSLPFLQSESFQTHVGTIHHRAIGPLSHHNGTSAYSPSLTCHLPAPTIESLHLPPYKLMCSSRPTYKHVCVRPISRPDCSIRISSKTIVTCLIVASVTMLLVNIVIHQSRKAVKNCCISKETSYM